MSADQQSQSARVADATDIEVARTVLARMGLTVSDLLAAASPARTVPTFGEYVPIVAPAVSAGGRVYGPYWDRVLAQWSERRLDEPTPPQIEQLLEYTRTHVVRRRNARGGRAAAEHLVGALRCLYQHAERDGLITEAANPARKVAKPRRLATTRRAIP
ncbi:MAG TPA: hypothetical protein VFE65_12635 [Pseudonocardia sp.]|jgi:hypothetical protein|nr:hypothetical protein [Pseudonocardia sp.]